NIIVPAGTARIGTKELNIEINGSPSKLAGLGDLPVKSMGSTVIRLKDVAVVHDGFVPQENVVRVNGMRSTYLTVFKHVGASTLTVVSDVKKLIPHIESLLPPGIHLKPFFDQSVFVKQALVDVIMEGVIGTLLVSLMIYLFLGDLRSTV
ncbi:Acriflavin resistance protein, partial [mine drainage metagenome]